MALVELFESGDAEEAAVGAIAEEGHARIEESIHVQCMDVLGQAVRSGEAEVALQQIANVRGQWIVNRYLASRQDRTLPRGRLS